MPIGKSNIFALTASTLIDHVRARRSAGANPATVGNDLTWIGVVLRAAKSVEALPFNPAIVEEARTACRELWLVGKSSGATVALVPKNSCDSMSTLGAAMSLTDSDAGHPVVRSALGPHGVA